MIQSASYETNYDEATYIKRSSLTGTKKTTTVENLDTTNYISSNITGKLVALDSGNDINIIGSNIISDNGTMLNALNDINILSSTDTTESTYFRDVKKSGLFSNGGLSVTIGKSQTSTDNKNSSTTLAGSMIGSLNGDTIITAGNEYNQVASDVISGHADEDGNFVASGDTAIQAKKININAGDTTNIIGGQITGDKVKLIASNLNIESLQDTSTYDSQQKNISGQITVGAGWGSASGSASKSDIDANYASVNEQSGIIAGDKGYDVSIVNNTNLIGGIITSIEKAEDDNLNSFSTGTLSVKDIENYANASVDSAGYSLSANDFGSKYTIAKAIGRNLMDSADESESSSSTTYSAINADNITIVDNEAQLALTGKTAEETISSINNNTINTNTALEQIDYEALVDDVEIERRLYNNVSEVAIAFSDEAYRTMFLREHPVVQILTDENGKILIDEDGKLQTKVLTPEEAKNLQAGSDGKINIVANGIFNDEEAAAKYAAQHSNGDGPIYAIVFPKADNAVSELMIAGYQKFLENEYTGLTNSTTQVVNYMNTYGESGLDIDAHSRGSLTVGNAIEYLAANGQNVLDTTSINLFGPAYNAQDMANLLYTTSNGQQNYVTLYNHVADPVGTYIGNNPATGGSIPSDSNLYFEMLRAVTGQVNTSHNLYIVMDENFRPYLPLDVRNELINGYHAVPVRGLPVPATNQ